MSIGLPGSTPLDYTGIMRNVVPIKLFFRRPLTTDKKYRVGQMALLGLNPSTGSQGELWYLANFDSSGDAIWVQFEAGASVPAIDSITTDSGAPPVEPDGAGNVDILGGTGIAVTGTGGDTVTVAVDGSLVTTSYAADSGTAAPAAGVLTLAGAGALTTSAAGSTVTFSISGTGYTWSTITAATKTMVVNEAYFADRGAGVAFTLPGSAAVGDSFIVSGVNAGGWTIGQNGGQTTRFGASTTTAGAGGSLASTANGDTVTIVCSVANTDFQILNSVGNITIV